MADFETKVCGRCGGSGHYSYNLMHGTMCYGCKGAGNVFTKRGLAAKQFFEDSLSRPAEDVKVGDIIRCWSCDRKFYAVTKTSASTWDDGRIVIELELTNGVYRCMEGSKIRVGADGDTKKAKLAAALAFQATLTAAGTPSKRIAKKA